jgi:hypothetical protein
MTSTLANAITDQIDDLPSGDDGSRLEQYKDSLRAQFDALLDAHAPDAELLAFADQHDIDLPGLDTGEPTLNPPIHIGLLTADPATALATALAESAEALFDIPGRVAR